MVSMQPNLPRRIATAAGLICAILGTAVLVGWHYAYLPLIQVFPAAAAPMQRLTALSFLLSGGAMIFLASGRRRTASILQLIVFLVALLVISEYLFGINPGIDELLGRGYVNTLTSDPGRPSPVTALCFAALSGTMLTMWSKTFSTRTSPLRGVVGSVIGTMGAISFLGYMIGHTAAYGWGQFTRVAPHTGLGFVVLGCGLVALAWQEKRESGLPGWIPFSVTLAVAAGVLGLWQALIAHTEANFNELSFGVLIGGFVVAVLLGVTVYLAQKAWERNRDLVVYRMAFENSFDGLLLTRPDGSIQTANPSACAILGRSEEEIRQAGRSGLVDASEGRLQKIIDDRNRWGTAHGELNYKRKDGSLFPVEISSVVFKDASGEFRTTLAFRDISERKKAEEDLRQSEERFRRIFEEGPIGLALVGKDYRFLKVNSSLCEMVGYTEQELHSLTFADITYPPDLQADFQLAEQLFNGEIPFYRMEKRYVRKNGELVWINLTGSVIRDAGGDVLYGLAMVEDISERKRAEEQLKEQAILLDRAHDAIIVRDLQAHVVFWNKGAENTYGISREQATGRITHELLKTQFPIPLNEIEEAVIELGQWEGELVHITGSGKHITVASRWSLLRDESGNPRRILEINRDITLRKEAESKLRLQTERLSLATQVASVGVWEWDVKTNQSMWDDVCCEMYGMPKHVSMSYDKWARLVHPDDFAQVAASLRRTIEMKSQDYVEFRIVRPDGTVRYISSAEGVVLDEHGEVTRMVGVNIDVTEQRRMQAQLEASSRLSSLGMMAGGIAHEINNPLTIIHASASDLIDMAQEGEHLVRGDVVRKCKRIRETADRIARIVKSLRRIAREGSQDEFFPAPVSKIVEETLEMCRETFKAKSVKLIVPEIDPSLTVLCREVQIAQVLLNLLQNAFDAVVDESGERWVRLDVSTHDSQLVFAVSDSGPGVPPELKSKIMEPFFTTKDVGKGTGLGLSLSTSIAEDHGGKLELTEEGGHTCFCLTLPITKERSQYAAS
jgi:PAS domain S-box-containing protein